MEHSEHSEHSVLTEAPQKPTPGKLAAMLRSPVLRVTLVAVLLLGAQMIDTRLRLSGLQEEFARRLTDGDAQAKEARALARQNQETTAALQAKVGALEAKLSEAQSQALALEAMYQELSSTRDERLLAEVEQAVSIAMQQLQFAGNVEAALLALQTADTRLARTSQPQFFPVRALIARDIQRLKATPGADVTGISLKIESVVTAADSLPLAYEQRPKTETAKSMTKSPADAAAAVSPLTSAFWQALGVELWREMRQLVRIERIEQSDPLLLSPTQSFFLRENLKLRLLNARLALLQRDGKTFREEIRLSREQLDRHFDPRAKAVMTAQATLRQLSTTDVAFDMPGLAETLAVLRKIKFAPARSSNSNGNK